MGTAGMYVSEPGLGGFRAIYNNVWPTMETNIKYAQNGVMWVYGSYSGQTGFKDPGEWLAYAEVTGDIFRDF